MKYVSPEVELLAFAATDVLMLSDDEEIDVDTLLNVQDIQDI